MLIGCWTRLCLRRMHGVHNGARTEAAGRCASSATAGSRPEGLSWKLEGLEAVGDCASPPVGTADMR